MTAFRTHAISAATHILAAFGESVTYKPFGGTARTITAVVGRQPAGKVGGGKETVGPRMTVSVANSVITGIGVTEFAENKDLITLAVNLGETAQDRLLTRILEQDEGMIVLGVK